MNIDGRELPTLLRTLRPLLRDARADKLQESAAELRWREDYSVEELACFAEFFRLSAGA